MAEEDEDFDHRLEKHDLINGLKSIVEGLLATHTNNVWNTYGGLPRVCKQVELILHHGLKSTQGDFGSQQDFWPFVQGLKRLNPVLAPAIEKINRRSLSSPETSKGHRWVRESLSEHNLSSLLKTLVSHRKHLEKYYYDHAFLRCKDYYSSLNICLQAVEQNKVALLAELDLGLLNHGRTSSAPVMMSSSAPVPEPARRSSYHQGALALAPPFTSPKRESILCKSDEYALPSSIVSTGSPQETTALAKEALRTVLRKSGSESPTHDTHLSDPTDGQFSFYNSINSDPLGNMDFNQDQSDPFETAEDSENGSQQNKVLLRSQSEMLMEVSKSGIQIAKSDTNLPKKKIRTKCKPEDIFSDSESRSQKKDSENLAKSSPSKKLGHKRSRSDIGVKNVVTDSVDGKVLDSDKAQTLGGNGHRSDHLRRSAAREGYFPQPQQGQSLINYLSSQDFHTCANLDKENAHFSISEALIAAIEQMKWNHIISPHTHEEDEGDSDEEIQELKQRIRVRKRERLKEKGRGFPAFSDGRTDNSSESSDLDEGRIELTMTEDVSQNPSNLSLLSSQGLSLSLASLYSDADIQKSNTSVEKQSSLDSGFVSHSAESVAISLLKKFTEKQLPKASDLQWLVPECDAPQKLLPLPNSYPISPDDGENAELLKSNSLKTRLRGNLEWAPPRPQIIFNIHPAPKRSTIMAKQSYMCAGCGMRVEQGYIRRFRYCEYLGKYFCQCCHSNSLSYIPGRILRRWDFKKYYVSNFSRDLISRIIGDPLFNLTDINSSLYRRVRALDNIKDLRTQLTHLKNFLRICKSASNVLGEVEQLQGHWTDDIHLYSLSDLVQVKSGEMLTQLRNIVNISMVHVQDCPFCQGLGFFCEMCHDKEVIFPFELQKVTVCPGCRACYHKQCFVPDKCPKCARIEARRLRLAKDASTDIEEMDEQDEIDDG
ncbi:run domain Beclin-1-interacting and cysteine-rich domain-containing protein-like isoform X2 [Mizuhopecten yessoensis]|uniref:run domain Beclin-1-interacting and cysteine-rich domain-containing protein-like isoform X2 n=1 Tax=Mizuhopecten yessoensis TaxID=6573 RepID=UPI000B45CF10|nr:run domain Beclin-1-interacting and cysteine-rich domain-containing protein-like isoform X2 [Mizuhopecten yessoensis]